ncbi:MAG: N-acetylmuramoyl-L-alanine amidase [Phycisphaerae bacterium]|nr:N-acetylmuramoyl-L-alanine amidase [Phycisphaerae bacterium]
MTNASTRRRINAPRLARTHVVWGALVAAMTGVGGLLLALDRSPAAPAEAVALVNLERANSNNEFAAIFDTKTPIKPGAWTGIVIHHSGGAIGSAETLTKQHNARGFKGLGYHFVISNGQGAPDGQIFVGYRWSEQLPGVHVAGSKAEQYNRQTIGICLIGDGERREFTSAQIARLAELVSSLQSRLQIPDRNVVLHRDISPTASPGRLFPEATFRQLLADAN